VRLKVSFATCMSLTFSVLIRALLRHEDSTLGFNEKDLIFIGS
jgi:hypothetical protein